MKITPLFDRVVLRPTAETRTDGGIYLPQTTNKSQTMQVEQVGAQCTTALLQGDTVIVHRFAGTEFLHGEEKLFIIKETDILGVIK